MKQSLQAYLEVKKKKGQKSFALLIDPDAFHRQADLEKVCRQSNTAGVDLFLLGGSLITNGSLDACISTIRKHSHIPVFLFPGNILQLSKQADGILLLSLISGRNPDLLIGKHVLAAPLLKKSTLEVVPTGYILVDGGRITSVSYMSNTTPIPADKPDIAACTAMAGELLGMRMMYMDAGSGAQQAIPEQMIRQVSQSVQVPLVVGGGIRTAAQAVKACKAGADMVVVGNAAEKDAALIGKIARAVHSL